MATPGEGHIRDARFVKKKKNKYVNKTVENSAE